MGRLDKGNELLPSDPVVLTYTVALADHRNHALDVLTREGQSVLSHYLLEICLGCVLAAFLRDLVEEKVHVGVTERVPVELQVIQILLKSC